MSHAPLSARLLRQVAQRLRLREFGRALYWSLMAVSAVYLAALLASRLTGFFPEYFPWTSLAVIPAGALLLGLACHRRPRLRDAAQAVDQSIGSRDLYLTLSLLETSAGEYQPLVVQSAEERASRIQPAAVVPFGWSRRDWQILWLPAAIAAAMLFVPQLDPFGKVAAASLSTERQERLKESRRETQLRIAEIKKEAEDRDESEATEQAIDKLQLTFNKMQPQQKRLNFESLMDEQKQLGELWRKLANEQLQNLLKAAPQASQQFGSGEQELMQKWTKELQAGSTDSLQQEMQELKKELQRLAKSEDPVEKEKLKQEIKERLDRLEKFAQKNLDAKALSASLQRAMKQMDLASLDNLSAEALEAALESLELSEMELQELAQSAQDLKSLEEALKTLQMAKRLNDRDSLDGKDCQSCKSLADYEKLYRELLAKCEGQCAGAGLCPGCGQCNGNGKGLGMGGRGTGEGNVAPEDNSIENDYQTEISKSAVTAGKVLLSMKTKGLGEKGNAVTDYRSLLQQVQQGVSEALVQEQVPPGYHDGIKGYFDTLQPAEKSK